MGIRNRLGRPSRGEVPGDPSDDDDDELGLECEAYLTGRYVDRAKEQGFTVRTWMWLNQVAHGTWAELESVAAGGRRPGWEGVQPILARAAIAATAGAGDLHDVQHHLLVPLELRLMVDGDELSPRRLIELTNEVLYGISRSGGQ